jgi:hypothetical protein
VVQVIATTYKCITCNPLVYSSTKDTEAACVCDNPDMVWNNTLGSCFCAYGSILLSDLTCFACPNSLAPLDKYHCNCAKGSIWNNIVNDCIACDTIVNSTNTSVNALVCGCKTGSYWNAMTLSCTLATATCTNTKANVTCMNCGTILNTANTNSAAKTSTTPVIVLKTATTIPTLLGGTNTIYAKLTVFICNCASGFKWEAKLLRCYSSSTSTL